MSVSTPGNTMLRAFLREKVTHPFVKNTGLSKQISFGKTSIDVYNLMSHADSVNGLGRVKLQRACCALEGWIIPDQSSYALANTKKNRPNFT